MKHWFLLSLLPFIVSRAEARPWAEIKKSGYITLATDGDYEPFTKGETGKMEGFEVDLAKEVFGRLGIKTRWVKDDFEDLLDNMNKGKYDLVMSSLTITAARQKIVDFTDPTYCTGMVFISKVGSPTDVKGLKNKEVGVKKGTLAEQFLKEQGFTKINTYLTRSVGKSHVAFGKVEAFLDDQMAGIKMVESSLAKTVKMKVGPTVTTDRISIALPKGQDELRKQINAALAQVIKDGTYAKITKQWLPVDMKCKN